MDSEHDPLIGLELDGFVVTHALSHGGMGRVYEARHKQIGHRVAVKVLLPEHGGNVDLREGFLREARAMSAVKHPNVVEIHNFGQLPNGAAYLTMQLTEGETLTKVIAREAPMNPVRALALCDEILAALMAAHSAGVIHRDLKPDNIVLMAQSSGEHVVKVLDFGLARQVDQEDLHHAIVVGTPEYISPEQACGRLVGPQGDLYSLGIVLFEMLTGQLPFLGDNPWELLDLQRTAIPPLLSARLPCVDTRLEGLVDQLLAKDPQRRPESAKDARAQFASLCVELKEVEAQPILLLGPLARRLDSDTPAPPPRRRSKLAGPLRAAALSAIALVALSFAPSRSEAVQPPPAVEAVAVLEPIAPPPAPTPAAEEPRVFEKVPVTPTPVRTVTPVKRKAARRAPLVAVAAPPAPPSCEPNAAWKRQMIRQIDELEQRSTAALPENAAPSLVADVKRHARALANVASNGDCAAEALVQSWRNKEAGQ